MKTLLLFALAPLLFFMSPPTSAKDSVSFGPFERACHERLLITNLKQLMLNQKGKKNAYTDTTGELKKELKRVQSALSRNETALGKSKINYNECTEKVLEHPITIDAETGQLVISNDEEDF